MPPRPPRPRRPSPIGDDDRDACPQVQDVSSGFFVSRTLPRQTAGLHSRPHAAANHKTAMAMATHADILWDARNAASVSAVTDSLSAVSLRSASPWDSRSPDRRARSPDRHARSPGRSRDNGRQPFRRSTPGRQDSRDASASKKFCHCHRTYGVKAHKCQSPCEWTENEGVELPRAAQRPRRPHFSSE